MYSATLLTAALAATALAAPATLKKRVDDGAQSCTATDHGLFSSYSIQIGAKFDVNVCGPIHDALASSLAQATSWTNWQCVDDGNGHFQLWFNLDNAMGDYIDQGLSSVFPPTGGQYGNVNGFNCPDY